MAIDILKRFHRDNSEEALLFSTMMASLGITNRSNFNKTIRQHPAFKEAMERWGVSEVTVGDDRYRNAFSAPFGPDPEATYVCEV